MGVSNGPAFSVRLPTADVDEVLAACLPHFERLRGEYGFRGGKTVVKDAVRAWRQSHQEVFLPLSHPPGEAQVDFGEATVKLNGVETKVALFVMTLPYSGAIFIQAFPRECTETFLEGHRQAFEFFGGVPRRISYDNLAIAVIEVLKGRERKLTKEFLRLQSHYLFQEHFCLVRRPNEKGHVERLVGFARRNFLVPVPQINSWEMLNQQLRERCPHLAVVGQSLGGVLATLLVAESTDITALALLAPYFEMPKFARSLTPFAAWLELALPYLVTADERSIHDPAARALALSFGTTTPRLTRELKAMAERARAALPGIRVPTLYIQSREDNRIESAVAERSFEALGVREKRLVWLEKGGHVVAADEAREQVAALTAEWLAAR